MNTSRRPSKATCLPLSCLRGWLRGLLSSLVAVYDTEVPLELHVRGKTSMIGAYELAMLLECAASLISSSNWVPGESSRVLARAAHALLVSDHRRNSNQQHKLWPATSLWTMRQTMTPRMALGTTRAGLTQPLVARQPVGLIRR